MSTLAGVVSATDQVLAAGVVASSLLSQPPLQPSPFAPTRSPRQIRSKFDLDVRSGLSDHSELYLLAAQLLPKAGGPRALGPFQSGCKVV
ncbi:hypothetical protein F444_20159 [Phytophthora nicotianae P1976]|uniref:Uncharacterized protein n=1 Tax=Phytophthora nicotianae P1976 TaxID=1317066 RepID=A0A080Z5H4_PHYNI|nr:hypothetical protein F444_20159 [Phytophthora nicotianae P1976]